MANGIKNECRLASKAILDIGKCHGEMAIKKEDRSDMSVFLNKTLANKYVEIIAKLERRALGRRTEKVFKPRSLIAGIIR